MSEPCQDKCVGPQLITDSRGSVEWKVDGTPDNIIDWCEHCQSHGLMNTLQWRANLKRSKSIPHCRQSNNNP
jgi:hypothetical protein